MNAELLAKSMNVTTADVESLLRMVSQSLIADKMKDVFLEMNELERVNVVEAYVSSEVKKFSNFCVSLMTNQDKRSAFEQYMYFQLKES